MVLIIKINACETANSKSKTTKEYHQIRAEDLHFKSNFHFCLSISVTRCECECECIFVYVCVYVCVCVTTIMHEPAFMHNSYAKLILQHAQM